MLKEEDFIEYDKIKYNKEYPNSKKVLRKIARGNKLLPNIYYWDNTLSNIIMDINIENYNIQSMEAYLEKLKKVYNTYKQGFLISDNEIQNSEDFHLLMEYLSKAANAYVLKYRKPFMILNIKYNKLDEFEIRCIFEYLLHDSSYLQAVKYHDTVFTSKVPWYMLKDMIEKYKKKVELGFAEYNVEGKNSW